MNEARAGSSVGGEAGTPVVLIAEDERAIAAVVAVVVEELGYEPRVVANGVQALQAAQADWPALVLTDFLMPGLNGAELITALRREAVVGNRAPVPIILMTAVGVAKARRAGAEADAYIAKPFDLEELESLFKRFLSPI